MNLFNLSNEEGQNGARLLQKMYEAQSAEDTFYLYGLSTRRSASQSEDTQTILYVYPYEVDGIVVGSVLFQINESKLNAWIGNSEKQNTYIFNRDGAFLNSAGIDDSIIEKLSLNWISEQMRYAFDEHSNAIVKKGYNVLYGTIADTGLCYIRFIADQSSLALLNSIQIFYFLFLAFLLICGRIFFILVSREFKKHEGSFRDFYELSKSEIETLKGDVKEAKKDSFIQELLTVDSLEESYIFSQASSLSVPLSADYHFVIIGEAEYCTEDSIKALFSSFGQLEYLHCAQAKNMSIWIVGIDHFLSHKLLCEICNPKCVSVGKAYADCSQIHQSYAEARNHWDVSRNPEKYYSQLEQTAKILAEPYDALCAKLEAEELENFTASVQALIEDWKQNAFPESMQCHMWQKLILLTDSTLHRMYPEYKTAPLDAKEIIFIEDSEQLSELMSQQLSALMRLNKEKRRSQAPPLTLEAIIQFIKQNCNSENFSLQLLADHFEISLSYLSLYFKENYGENLLN